MCTRVSRVVRVAAAAHKFLLTQHCMPPGTRQKVCPGTFSTILGMDFAASSSVSAIHLPNKIGARAFQYKQRTSWCSQILRLKMVPVLADISICRA